MAGNPLTSLDLYDDKGHLKTLTAQLTTINGELEGITKKAAIFNTHINKLTFTKSSDQKELSAMVVQLDNLQKSEKRLLAAKSENAKQTAIVTEKIRVQNQENRTAAKLNNNLATSYNSLSAEMALNKMRLNAMTKEQRDNTKEGRELIRTIKQQNDELKRLDAQTGNHQRNVGNYLGSIKNFAFQVLGIGTAISVVTNLLNKSRQTVTDFNTALTDLGNDTLITAEQLQVLGNAAIEVSGGKLGTAATDILKIFQLLINANPELADNAALLKEVAASVNILSKAEKVNADIVAGVVTTAAKQFKISLSDSARIVDTLAAASDNGKAKLPELAEAIKEGGQVARTSGLSLKQYLDIIEAAASVGIKGGESATKLNKILSTLAKTGRDDLNPALRSFPDILRTLDKEFGVTAGSTNALGKATELFSAKSAGFVLAMINQADTIETLNSKTVEQGNAYADAAKNADTLTGRTRELTGEYEKLILKIDSGSGAISHFFKFWVEGGVGALRALRGELRSFQQEEFDKTIAEAFARGIKNSILGDFTSENVQKQLDDVDKIFSNINKNIKSGTDDSTASVKMMRTELKRLKDELILAKDGGDESAIADLISQIDVLEKKLNASASSSKSRQADQDAAFNKQIEIRKRVAEFIINDRDRELALLQINLDEQRRYFEQNGLDIVNLETKFAIERQKIQDKYARNSNITSPIAPLPIGKPISVLPETLLSEFDAEQAHQEKLFSLQKKTELDIQRFKLQQEIDRLDLVLKLNFDNGKELTAIEKKRLQQLRNALGVKQSELSIPVPEGPQDLFALLGFNNFDDKEKQAITDSLEFAKDQLRSYFDTVKELREQAVEDANIRVSEAQRSLQYEMDSRAAGFADKVEFAQKELALAKKQQADALKDRQRTAKEEIAINTALEASNLALAVASAFKLGPILGPIAAGIMIAAFAISKAKAFALASKKTFGKGGLIDVKGGSHASGNDTALGVNVDGKPAYAEGGEKMAIFSKKASRKYPSELTKIVNAANAGKLHEILALTGRASDGIAPIMVNVPGSDNRGMERRLDRMIRQGEQFRQVNPDGSVTIYSGSNKTTIRR